MLGEYLYIYVFGNRVCVFLEGKLTRIAAGGLVPVIKGEKVM